MSTEPEHRIRLALHYDGAGFHGWQRQPGQRTVQRELERALSRLLDAPVQVLAAGRTDAGVHATGQVAALTTPGRWWPDALRQALNAILPDDVWIARAEATTPSFHPRYDAVARGYVYRLGLVDGARSPFRRPYCWAIPRVTTGREEVDRESLDGAAALVRGPHSFASFAKAGQEERGDRCTVRLCHWRDWSAGVELAIVADRFLHHMVRYLVGTMVDVARHRRPLEDVGGLLAGAAGLTTSPPAPPQGLYLTRVFYDAAELESVDLPAAELPGA